MVCPCGGNCKCAETLSAEAPMKMSQEDLLSVFNSLKSKDSVSVWFDSGIRRANDWLDLTVGRKSRSKKYNLEKISLINPNNPHGAKFYLYNRQGRISLAMGDMATSLVALKKKSTNGAESFSADNSNKPLRRDVIYNAWKKWREGMFPHQMDELTTQEENWLYEMGDRHPPIDIEDWYKNTPETFGAELVYIDEYPRNVIAGAIGGALAIGSYILTRDDSAWQPDVPTWLRHTTTGLLIVASFMGGVYGTEVGYTLWETRE